MRHLGLTTDLLHSSVFLVGAGSWRVDVGSRFGEAGRMRRDRRERPRRGGRERDNGPARKTAPCKHPLYNPDEPG